VNAEFRSRMRVPVLATAALLGGLAINVTLAAWQPFALVWILELLVVAAMVSLVMWESMEIKHQTPLVQLFSGIGFLWVMILFGMTMLDYATR
jgi:cytochrome c oxidase subunit 4